MDMKQLKSRITELEDKLYRTQLKLERYEEVDVPAVPTSRITVPDIHLRRFKDHYNDIELEILSSLYLTSARESALSEIRYQVIHCPTADLIRQHEKNLMKSKAATLPTTVLGSLASDISQRVLLANGIDNQLALFNAIYELSLMEADPEIGDRGIRDFTHYLVEYDVNTLLGTCHNTSEMVVILRKAKASGDLNKISDAIEEIIGLA